MNELLLVLCGRQELRVDELRVTNYQLYILVEMNVLMLALEWWPGLL